MSIPLARPARSALILLAVQLTLVLCIAAKFLYQRRVCPRVWVRSAPADPNLPLRGRYIALSLMVDACTLPRDSRYYTPPYNYTGVPGPPPGAPGGFWTWQVALNALHGNLSASLDEHPSAATSRITLPAGEPCGRARLSSPVDYFIPDRTRLPLASSPGDELWVEVTVPPAGPPRPIQLALSTRTGFRPLHLE